MTHRRLPYTEFVALMAMLAATVAFSIDSMLPALPEIAAELTPDAPNIAQGIVISFVVGLGIGTLFAGPISDAFGRKATMLGGAALYIFASTLAWRAEGLEMMFAARALQGLGAAGPRVAAVAMIRDLYSGREMARLVSFVMIVFTLVPAIAPTIGAGIIAFAGWRGIFIAFIIFSALTVAWLGLRQAETRLSENRVPFRPRRLWAALIEVLRNRQVMAATAVQTPCFAMLFAVLISAQPIFDGTFGLGVEFPLYFGAISILAGSGAFLNAQLVGRLGMRFLVRATLVGQIVLSFVMALTTYATGAIGDPFFWLTFVWMIGIFFQAGLTIGNLNALAMEPMGHIAGMAASVISATATIVGGLLAVPLGQAFAGSPLPVATGVLVYAILALALMQTVPDEVRE